MAVINFASISKKVEEYCASERGREKLNKQLTDSKGANLIKYNGRMISATDFAYMIAEDFYDELVSLAYEALQLSTQQSVRDNIANTTVTEIPSCTGEYGGTYYWSVGITIGGTSKRFLYRDSFRERPNSSVRTGDGIDNIVALFNNGVGADGAVHGYWDNHGDDMYWSRMIRPSLGFIQEAARNVVEMYKRRGYFISIDISGEYDRDGKQQTID